LQQQIAALNDAVSKMEALDRQGSAGSMQLSRANAEKSKLYLQVMDTMPHCN
jgi:hypothetical protein